MPRTDESIMVIGIGRFGLAVARNLVSMGRDVIAVDEDPVRVQRFADELTMTVEADSTDTEALEQLGVSNYRTVVVAIGGDIEASIITSMNLINAGVPDIWAKAVTTRHGEILTKIGVHHVIFPERSMGARVAHVIADQLIDFLDFEDGSVLAATNAPKRSWGTAVSAASDKFGVTIIGLQLDGHELRAATPDEVVDGSMKLLVYGPKRDVERFCDAR